MIEVFGIKIGYEVLVFFTLFVLDEVIAASPLRENSVLQLLSRVLGGFKVMRKEDEVVAALRARLDAALEDIRKLEK
jgi:hypothetical protein